MITPLGTKNVIVNIDVIPQNSLSNHVYTQEESKSFFTHLRKENENSSSGR